MLWNKHCHVSFSLDSVSALNMCSCEHKDICFPITSYKLNLLLFGELLNVI